MGKNYPKLTRNNLHNHEGEYFYFSDLSKALQNECAIETAHNYDANGYGWHDEADEEELFIAEGYQAKGWRSPKVVSTQSFWVQGDSTCFCTTGIDDFEKWWDIYKSYFDGIKHAKYILKNMISFEFQESQRCWGMNTLIFDVDTKNYHFTSGIYREHYCDWDYNWDTTPRVQSVIEKIIFALEDIMQDENEYCYDAMQARYDWWYSPEHIKEEFWECDIKVCCEDGDWDYV